MNDIVARKESFGGIVGRRGTYGFNVVNKKAFEVISSSQKLETGVEYQLNKLPFFPLKKSVYLHDRRSDVHFSYFSPHNQFGCVGGNTVIGIKSNGVGRRAPICGVQPIWRGTSKSST